MSKTYAVIPAAGRGLRMGKDRPKQFLEVSGKPLLAHTLDTLSRAAFLSGILLVVPADFMEAAGEMVERDVRAQMPIRVIEGGAERRDSVYNALMVLPPDCEWVLVHDGVRPFASQAMIEAAWMGARETGASIAALPSTDTVKQVERDRVVDTLPREKIWLVQTPQVFRKDVILRAYREARMDGRLVTDDSSLVERLGIEVAVVKGEPTNIKVTTPADLVWAEWYLRKRELER